MADRRRGPDLVYRPDPADPGHGFIEPARPMTLAEYQSAAAATRPRWTKVRPPSSGGGADDNR